ncbi:DUF6807 domain-containing protein [Rubinisphaera italica]|uniref:Methane oxygenase PmoA n=1 Tax=Rubinisphaera italica TaxID=2527969 RepID=A0A5C5XAM2_9PLAN|nr:PmoA family protein [Rubinisphaera italica]TWT59343.1 hypothetical protein Pan54_00440 [Rubinisphaera italica]
MRIFQPISLALSLLLLNTVSLEAGKVNVVREGDKAIVNIDGSHFTTYNFADSQAKPYFHPILAPGDVLVVREQVFNKEGEQRNDAKTGMGHFHHKGAWIAIDTVNDGLNYWHEQDHIKNQKIMVSSQGDNGVIEIVNEWQGQNKKPLIKEETRYTITPDRLIVCELKLTAIDQPVTFGDTKEGLFAIRVNHSMREMSGGEIVNAAGEEGEKNCWGKPSPWIDYHGEVDGKTVGISLFDSEDNFRPSRYHVRGYGLFAINPFGEKKYSNGKAGAAPVTLQPGESVKLRYGLYVHEGDEKEGHVAEQYQKFEHVQ